MNSLGHGEERNDVASHLEFPLACRARQGPERDHGPYERRVLSSFRTRWHGGASERQRAQRGEERDQTRQVTFHRRAETTN